MKKSTRDYLLDIAGSVNDIRAFTAGMDSAAFGKDRKTQLAVIRAFEVIGEVAKRLPDALLDQQASVDWRAVKGFRDVLIHQYDTVDTAIVWNAVEQISDVQHAIEALLASLPPVDE